MTFQLDLKACLADARIAALEAWQAIKHYQDQTDLTLIEKPDDDPATEADLLADRFILDFLRARYSSEHYGFLSEESVDGEARLAAKAVWIVDPIDGTRDFIEGLPNFAVQIGLAAAVVEGGPMIPVVGVVYESMHDLLYGAAHGQGAWCEVVSSGKVENIQVSSMDALAEAKAVTSRSALNRPRHQALMQGLAFKESFAAGSLGVKLCHIAQGSADLYVKTGRHVCKEWDACAPHCILNEAGGRLTDALGCDIVYNKPNLYVELGIVGTNGRLHDEVIDRLEVIRDLWHPKG